MSVKLEFNIKILSETQASRGSYGAIQPVEETFFDRSQIEILNSLKTAHLDGLLEKVNSFNGAYKGELWNEEPHGFGTLAHSLASVSKIYNGQFKSGKPHGLGIECLRNDDWYEGEWESGVKHGKGRYHWNSGETFEGTFNRGALGRGELKQYGRVIRSGEWLNNQFNSEVYEDGGCICAIL